MVCGPPARKADFAGLARGRRESRRGPLAADPGATRPHPLYYAHEQRTP